MKQLTIRGLDEQLERALRKLARDARISLHRAALELSRRGAGRSARGESTRGVGGSLDRFIGVRSAEDETEFRRALEPMEQIDPELWA